MVNGININKLYLTFVNFLDFKTICSSSKAISYERILVDFK